MEIEQIAISEPTHKKLGFSSERAFKKYLVEAYKTKTKGDLCIELGLTEKILTTILNKFNINTGAFQDVTGQIINGIEIIKLHSRASYGHLKWLCKCHCKKEFIATIKELFDKYEPQKSCGCLRKGSKKNKVNLEPFKDEIIKLYLKEYKNGPEIAKLYNCHSSTIRRYLKKWEIKLRNKKERSFRGHKIISKKFVNSYKRHAQGRGRVFDISPKEIYHIYEAQDNKCKFTGEILSFPKDGKDYSHNASIDRIDSNLGYYPSNCQLVTKRANVAKNNMSNAEFIEMCQKVASWENKE